MIASQNARVGFPSTQSLSAHITHPAAFAGRREWISPTSPVQPTRGFLDVRNWGVSVSALLTSVPRLYTTPKLYP